MSETATMWQVGDEESGQRLDRFVVAHAPQFSRVAVQRLIEDGQVLVNHVPAKASYRLAAGDHVAAELPASPAPAETPPAPEPQITLHVIYEDASLAVIDKPAGLVVHPAHGHEAGTLLNALLARYPELRDWPGEGWPGLVHRLDRETSGLLLVARTPQAQDALRAQWKVHAVRKVYVALVIGAPQLDRARIDAPIARDPHQRQRMAVVPEGGREAVTEYNVLERLGNYTLLEAYPETGRTHQIRVHLAAIGHPVVGDHLYGPRRQRLDPGRHFLHAARLTFRHPTTGEELTFSAPLPAELDDVLGELRRRKT